MKPRLIIVTGVSGSGKTIALRALEDTGYSCVDNLPPRLIEPYATMVTTGTGSRQRVAIGIDIREREFLHEFDTVLPQLARKFELEVLFLEAEVDVLLRRFKETRRPHPLMAVSGGEARDMEEAIATEKGLLGLLRDNADRIVDTSPFTPHQLREHIASLYAAGNPAAGMLVTLMSFGFKYGVPRGIDMLFDVRFLPNPHFIAELKGLSGKDAPVREFVLGKEVTTEFLEKTRDFLMFLIPHYRREGKAYLTIGIGCTGGRHRSAAIVEELARMLKDAHPTIEILHRDL